VERASKKGTYGRSKRTLSIKLWEENRDRGMKGITEKGERSRVKKKIKLKGGNI